MAKGRFRQRPMLYLIKDTNTCVDKCQKIDGDDCQKYLLSSKTKVGDGTSQNEEYNASNDGTESAKHKSPVQKCFYVTIHIITQTFL